jgi:hypothetical protein
MASICGSPCVENEVQIAKIVCMVTLDEVDLIKINPPTYFVLQKSAMTFSVGSDLYQEIAIISSFAEDHGQDFTPFFGFVEDIQCEKIGMNSSSSK